MEKALNYTTIYHSNHDHQLHTPLLWQKSFFLLITAYKPNIAKTVYIFILHLLIYRNKWTVKSAYTWNEQIFTINWKQKDKSWYEY